MKTYLLGDNHWLLGLSISHLITDGWSLGLLLENFLARYHAYLHNSTYETEGVIPYANYAVWQQELMWNIFFPLINSSVKMK